MSETPYSQPRPVNGSVGASSYSDTLTLATNVTKWTPTLTPALRTRKIAILGFSETVRDAPVNDPSWELWGMNGFWRAARPDFGIDIPEDRYSLWFDMHTMEYTREYGKRAGFGDQQEMWLRQEHPFPIFMLNEDESLPSVLRFPIEDVIKAAGRDYFTSTVAYAIAWAAMQPDVAEIGLWGIDLVHDTEYADQRPCAEYHLARAEAAGIRVTTHERSALMRQRVRYGYESENPLLVDLRNALTAQAKALEDVVLKAREDMERARTQAHTDDGALQMVRQILGRLEMYGRGGRI